MSSDYRTRPQVKFKAFRDLERRRVHASDTVWAVLVASKLASKTLTDAPAHRSLLADRYPNLPHVARMNQRLDRAAQLMESAETALCTMAFNLAFGLHEDFLRECLNLLVVEGKATRAEAAENASKLHENLQQRSGHAFDADALALFHLTRKIRNAQTHAAGLVRNSLVDHYRSLAGAQRALWERLTGEPFRVPEVGDSAGLGVGGLIAGLAIQKRLAYDVNLALQGSIERSTWADIATREYLVESGKSPRDPTALRSLRGYLRGGFGALELTDEELTNALDRSKKSGTL